MTKPSVATKPCVARLAVAGPFLYPAGLCLIVVVWQPGFQPTPTVRIRHQKTR